MAKKVYEEENIRAIATAIREKADPDKIYNKTYTTSRMPEGVDEVYEKGKKKEWSDFWDACQAERNRAYYKLAFCGHGWTEKNFKPRYDIKPISSADNIFQESKINGSLIEILKECNVTFDSRGLTGGIAYGFSNTQFTEIPTIDVSNSTSSNTLNYAFPTNYKLVKIEKIILRDDGTQNFNGTFNNDTKLEEIRFEGTIGRSIDFKSSPLSIDSMKSIITHLMDYSDTSYVQTYSLTFNSDCWTALESSGTPADDGIDFVGTWREYVQNLGWTI